MNESIKNLLERRSIRAYKKELVPKETLDTILEAGEYSPSGMGQQSTLMVVTQDPELEAETGLPWKDWAEKYKGFLLPRS